MRGGGEGFLQFIWGLWRKIIAPNTGLRILAPQIILAPKPTLDLDSDVT